MVLAAPHRRSEFPTSDPWLVPTHRPTRRGPRDFGRIDARGKLRLTDPEAAEPVENAKAIDAGPLGRDLRNRGLALLVEGAW